MSDTSQGPGWWQASDGKWYPPEQAAPGASAPGPGAGSPPGPAFGSPPGPAPAYAGPGGPPAGASGQLVEWPQRVLATLIDTGIILVGYVVVFILTAILGAISDVLGTIFFIIGYLFIVGLSFYFSYLTGVNGQSPGKKIIGIKVIGEQTGQP
ncbi:MAG: RDD family protein, partial [Acidimicrobiia bacterium]|nr:RDD family protein [Acidimicrobiia bacterium]